MLGPAPVRLRPEDLIVRSEGVSAHSYRKAVGVPRTFGSGRHIISNRPVVSDLYNLRGCM